MLGMKFLFVIFISFSVSAHSGDNDFLSMIERAESGSTIEIEPGDYDVCSTAYIKNKNDIKIVGVGEVKIRKCNSFNGEYILSVIDSDNVSIDGVSFYGLTDAKYINENTTNIVWGEQGVLFSGTSGSSVENSNFYNFGDAALRITSSRSHYSGEQVNSKNFRAEGNVFYNVTQVTTTHPWSKDFGGTRDIIFKNNLFYEMKGGLKLSSRKGVSNAMVESNIFNFIHGSAMEVNYYSNVVIKDNSFSNVNKFILNVFPNSISNVNEAIDWNGLSFIKNTAFKSRGGIRIVSDVAGELISGKHVSNVIISANKFVDVDMSLYGVSNRHIINFLENEKKFIYSVVKMNSYNTSGDVSLLNVEHSTNVQSLDNVELKL
ncbi:right-handed parallel beta-helix repeat-containing protein [Pseudoalteromonas peptidolytica]|uniref:Right handed beta helix domain-containing protein n=1 Tax=Pseudoalteromonas peptidolytica F12-50-A1 TaxID=1315280 RepID=A0A8I0N0N0_9GAMM|nr:right-handed parallel beta-helix repeat-containing protein [Pseudoalteromonas peptidolytica]MBE0348565.1 hypothetical protein [Pseudoalteromonas peptidolytica F12-50-A1]NLR17271.1 hypothetical protein [Pseudoalteromonas peptidolytica]GEK11938.1 hypothetical protein PPE03_41870 [Pseudoalteromonas peptidolytica]